MKSVRTISVICFIIFLTMMCSCGICDVGWNGYSGTMVEYEYYYTDDRNRAWEEDVLYLADVFLNQHPMLHNDNTDIYIITALSDTVEYDYSKEFYDASKRSTFIEQINILIPKISDLEDDAIVYELQRIVAALGDAHSCIDLGFGEVLPIVFEPIHDGTEIVLYSVRIPAEYENALFGKLTAINGVPAEEVMERMKTYISYENNNWAVHNMTSMFSDNLLAKKAALQAIGVVDADAENVEFTFQTDAGIVSCVLNFVTVQDYWKTDIINHSMMNRDLAPYRYLNEKRYWYEVMDVGNTMYVRFSVMYRDPEMPLDRFLLDIGTKLRDAEEPMKLVLDFRDNIGGESFQDGLRSFASAVNRYETNGVYILIDGSSFSNGVATPYLLCTAIEGATLIGEPTAQSLNFFSGPTTFTMPNHEYTFSVSTSYNRIAPECIGDALQPDVLIHQTLEDYKIGKDTVLEYVLSIE